MHLDGLFYQGDVWWDSSYLGNTEGYFFPHTFEVSDVIRPASDHLLAVEVACSRPADKRSKRNLTGVFQHWDCIDPDWNPGGIWRPVHLTETGPVRIARLRVLCLEASSERAIVEVRAVLDSTAAGIVTVTTTSPRPHRPARSSTRSPPGSTTCGGRWWSTNPLCGGPTRWAISRCTRCRSRWPAPAVTW